MNRIWEDRCNKMKAFKRHLVSEKRNVIISAMNKRIEMNSKILVNNKSHQASIHKDRIEKSKSKEKKVREQVLNSYIKAEEERLDIENKNRNKSNYKLIHLPSR